MDNNSVLYMLNDTARPPNLKYTLTILENYSIYNLNYGNRKLRPLSSTLPAAPNSIFPTACLPLLQTHSREPLNTALWTCFRQTKAKTWNLSRVQIHGRWHVQLSLFVPVKCALALINWHHYILLPHLSLHYHYIPQRHFMLPPTSFSLCQRSECYWRRAWADQHLSVAHVSTTKIAHGLTCHFNL